MKPEELRVGLFISIEFGDTEFRSPELIINVGPESFQTQVLSVYGHGKIMEHEYVYDAILYHDEDSLPGPRLMDVLRIVSETDVIEYLEKQALQCDKRVEEAWKCVEANTIIAETYRKKAKTILDEAHKLAAK